MSNIVVGDNGTILQCTISDDSGVVNITGSSVSFTIKSATKRNVKQGTVFDGANGVAQCVLEASDLDSSGNYIFQATVSFDNGNVYSSNTQKFKVDPKL